MPTTTLVPLKSPDDWHKIGTARPTLYDHVTGVAACDGYARLLAEDVAITGHERRSRRAADA